MKLNSNSVKSLRAGYTVYRVLFRSQPQHDHKPYRAIETILLQGKRITHHFKFEDVKSVGHKKIGRNFLSDLLYAHGCFTSIRDARKLVDEYNQGLHPEIEQEVAQREGEQLFKWGY